MPLKFLTLLSLSLMFFGTTNSTSAAERQSTYERVMLTKTLRCGYFIWPPHFDIDLKTGQAHGVYHDIIQELGHTLGLKIEWAEEYSLGTQVEALKSNKIDALCADGPWTRSALPYLDYSEPYYFVPGFIYGLKSNPRLKPGMDLRSFNSPDFRLTSLDGDGSEEFTRLYFPTISRLSIPSTAPPSLLLENILSGKADIMWNDPLTIAGYPPEKQAQLVNINPSKPVGVFPFVISVAKNNDGLLRMLNQGIDVMTQSGSLEKMIQSYRFPAGSVYLPAPKYRAVLPSMAPPQ